MADQLQEIFEAPAEFVCIPMPLRHRRNDAKYAHRWMALLTQPRAGTRRSRLHAEMYEAGHEGVHQAVPGRRHRLHPHGDSRLHHQAQYASTLPRAKLVKLTLFFLVSSSHSVNEYPRRRRLVECVRIGSLGILGFAR